MEVVMEVIEAPSVEDLIRARQVLGLTQTELGRALGRSLRQMQRLECGETAATAETALALLALFHGLDAPGALARAIEARAVANARVDSA
jgi:transcriptional regulator with XRE-family HTH domain